MDINLIIAWVVMLVLRAVWIMIVPTIVIIAVCKLWRSVPIWISIAFIISSIISVLISVPHIMIMLKFITSEQYTKIAIPLVVIGGLARLASAIALLALAIIVKKMTQQRTGA